MNWVWSCISRLRISTKFSYLHLGDFAAVCSTAVHDCTCKMHVRTYVEQGPSLANLPAAVRHADKARLDRPRLAAAAAAASSCCSSSSSSNCLGPWSDICPSPDICSWTAQKNSHRGHRLGLGSGWMSGRGKCPTFVWATIGRSWHCSDVWYKSSPLDCQSPASYNGPYTRHTQNIRNMCT